MAKLTITTVDDYIAAQPESVHPILNQVRAAIRKALPTAEEVISYKMPAYRMDGRTVIYFAGWKSHYSIYPAGEKLRAAFEMELSRFEVSKGTIRFPLAEKVPVRLISRLAKFRAEESLSRR